MLSQIAKTEIMNRTRSLDDEELKHTLKFIPTKELLQEIARREGVITDTINNMCGTWSELTLNKPFEDMGVMEKEKTLQQLRRVLYYGE